MITSATTLTLGEHLRRARRNYWRWTQAQAAEFFKISQPSYHRWENDESKPSIEQLKLLRMFLRMSGDEVIDLL